MARLHSFYREKVVPELMQSLGVTNPMQVPKITKISVNMGVGEAVADKKAMDGAVSDLTKEAGRTRLRAVRAGLRLHLRLDLRSRA